MSEIPPHRGYGGTGGRGAAIHLKRFPASKLVAPHALYARAACQTGRRRVTSLRSHMNSMGLGRNTSGQGGNAQLPELATSLRRSQQFFTSNRDFYSKHWAMSRNVGQPGVWTSPSVPAPSESSSERAAACSHVSSRQPVSPSELAMSGEVIFMHPFFFMDNQ